MVKNSFIEKTYVEVHVGIISWRQFQYVPTIYVAENKEENYLEIYIFGVSCPLSLPKLPTSIKIPVTLLQIVRIFLDSYISKFEFMNYPFAYLVVAWSSYFEFVQFKCVCMDIRIYFLMHNVNTLFVYFQPLTTS